MILFILCRKSDSKLLPIAPRFQNNIFFGGGGGGGEVPQFSPVFRWGKGKL